MERKMHCALQEISTDRLEISKAGKDSLSKKTQEQWIFTTPLKDCEDSCVSRNADSRHSILAFLTCNPDGKWGIAALPVQFLNHISLASAGNMHGLQLHFQLVLNGPKVDQHKAQKRPLPDSAYSVKSSTGRSITRSNVHLRCQNKIANRAAKLNELTGNSGSQSLLICSNSSSPDRYASVNSSDMFVSSSKADKSVKKKSKRKGRKKVRQSKKESCDGGSTKAEVLPQEYVRVSLSSEIFCSNDVDNLNGLMSYTAGPEFLFSDDRLLNNKSERSEMGYSINLTDEPKNCTSNNNEVEMSEAITSTVQKPSGEHAVCNSKNQPQNGGPKPAVVDGETEGTQHVRRLHYGDMSSKDFSNRPETLALYLTSVGSKSDESSNAGNFVKQSNKASCSVSLSEPPGFDPGEEYILGHKLLNGGGSTSDHNEDGGHGAENHGSSDKRVKQKRAVPGSSSLKKSGGLGNLHGQFGKENNRSVWQKVRKNDSDEGNGDLKKLNSIFSQSDSNSKKVPHVNRNSNFAGDNYLLKTEDKKHLKNEVGRKSGGKIGPALEKGYSSYSWKGSHFNRSILNDNTKISIQQNEMSHISSEGNSQQGWSSVSRSHSCINSPMLGFETSGVELITLESVRSAQDHLQGSVPPKDALPTISTMNTQNMEDQDSLLPMARDNTNQSSISEEPPPMHSHLLDDEVSQTEKEVSSADYGGKNQSSGSTLRRWIPVGKKNARLAVSEYDFSSLEYSDVPSTKDFTLEQNHVSSFNANITCSSQIYPHFSCLDKDESVKLGTQFACTFIKQRDKHVVPHHLVYGCRNLDAHENDSYRIAQAVNDASRAQLACESVHMVTGDPIAEFERLLHCCSPVICQSTNPLSCLPLTCLHDHAGDVLPSGQETPDLSLGSLWQWYEKHGSYGLEVRAQERLGLGLIPFRAYFVPYLSAVQLFKNCNNQCVQISKMFSNCKASEQSEISDMSENSSAAGQHPIFSACFPRPCSQGACIPTSPTTNELTCSEVSSVKDNASLNSACSCDIELLFEYFESEQPQQRQPLYERIEDLVKGDVPTKAKVYGDPTKLNSINLQDLHPRSWYSVAWYPIYRIPDGNFRAAFLTYHSLGHLVHRSIKTDSSTVNSCVVAPVVGLQSYNAQSECWFQLSHSVQTALMSDLNPSILLKERLQTLEETASLMARAVVKKGNLICTNRHPDYEFFISRRRY